MGLGDGARLDLRLGRILPLVENSRRNRLGTMLSSADLCLQAEGEAAERACLATLRALGYATVAWDIEVEGRVGRWARRRAPEARRAREERSAAVSAPQAAGAADATDSGGGADSLGSSSFSRSITQLERVTVMCATEADVFALQVPRDAPERPAGRPNRPRRVRRARVAYWPATTSSLPRRDPPPRCSAASPRRRHRSLTFWCVERAPRRLC